MEYTNEDFNDDLWGQIKFSCQTPMIGCRNDAAIMFVLGNINSNKVH